MKKQVIDLDIERTKRADYKTKSMRRKEKKYLSPLSNIMWESPFPDDEMIEICCSVYPRPETLFSIWVPNDYFEQMDRI